MVWAEQKETAKYSRSVREVFEERFIRGLRFKV
jgi:hypothetical protein